LREPGHHFQAEFAERNQTGCSLIVTRRKIGCGRWQTGGWLANLLTKR
jgi:hypothetical protein